MSVKYKRLLNHTHHKHNHKAHLLSCAIRCSSKLQKIQSLENFVSMAIQGAQVPIYTNTHWFFFFFFNGKQNKQKMKTTKHKETHKA